jgi:hypothetical protein
VTLPLSEVGRFTTSHFGTSKPFEKEGVHSINYEIAYFRVHGAVLRARH